MRGESQVQLRGAALLLRYWRRDIWVLAENASERNLTERQDEDTSERQGENASEGQGELDLSQSGMRFGRGDSSDLLREEKDKLLEKKKVLELDELLEKCCAFYCRNGFNDDHLPPRLGRWLKTEQGKTFVGSCMSMLSRVDSLVASNDGDGEKFAWMVRAVQLQLREVAPKVMGKSVGEMS